MQILATILGLAAAAAAIDARLYYNRGCTGSGVQCGGLNPDTCCPAGGNDFGSVEFRYIPIDWTIEGRGHSGGDCTNLQERGYPTRVDSICLSIGPFSGAGYGFRGKKRGEAGSADCAKRDSIFTEDGVSYNLADLDDDTVAKLVSSAASNANFCERLDANVLFYNVVSGVLSKKSKLFQVLSVIYYTNSVLFLGLRLQHRAPTLPTFLRSTRA